MFRSNHSTHHNCQSICKTILPFIPRCVVGFQFRVNKFCITMVVFMYNDRFDFPQFTCRGCFVITFDTVGSSVLPTISLINPCTVLRSLYLLIPSLINPYKSKVSIRRKISTSLTGISVLDYFSSTFLFSTASVITFFEILCNVHSGIDDPNVFGGCFIVANSFIIFVVSQLLLFQRKTIHPYQ